MEILLVFIVVVLAFFGQAWLFQWLWNWLAVGLFHAPVVGYWQAMGMTLFLAFVGNFFRSVTTKKN